MQFLFVFTNIAKIGGGGWAWGGGELFNTLPTIIYEQPKKG